MSRQSALGEVHRGLVLYIKSWGRAELGRLEASGGSLGGRVGYQLGRLGSLTGRRIFW
jgi:hypothetical protein